MTTSLLITLNAVFDVAVVALLAFVMSRASRLTRQHEIAVAVDRAPARVEPTVSRSPRRQPLLAAAPRG